MNELCGDECTTCGAKAEVRACPVCCFQFNRYALALARDHRSEGQNFFSLCCQSCSAILHVIETVTYTRIVVRDPPDDDMWSGKPDERGSR